MTEEAEVVVDMLECDDDSGKGMNLKTSEPNLCIFCMCRTFAEVSLLLPEVCGANGNLPLQKELQAQFILRQILDIPSYWIEKQMQVCGSRGLLQDWFHLCADCFMNIFEAWGLYQEGLRIQTKLRKLKDKLKRKILDSTKRNLKNKENGIMKKIREFSRSNLGTRAVPLEPKIDYVELEDEDFSQSQVEVGHKERESSPVHENKSKKRKSKRISKNCTNADIQLQSPVTVTEPDEDFVPDGAEDNWSDGDISGNEARASRKNSKASIKKAQDSGNEIEISKSNFQKPKRKRIWKKRFRPSKRWPFKCVICATKFKTESEFTAHKEAHERNKLDNKVFDCKLCNYPCKDLPDLENHNYEKHMKNRTTRGVKYTCKVCPYTVKTHYQLEKHVRNEHPDLPEEDCGLVPLTCKICHKTAGNINAAISHTKLMHPEVHGAEAHDSLFECEECGERFQNEIRFKYHMNKHLRSKNQKLQYTCEVCGKGFKWASRLRQHLPAHDKFKQWMCSTCGVDFTYKNGLERHDRLYHATELSLNPNLCAKGSQNSKGNGVPLYQCPICKLTMPLPLRKRHLKTHRESFTHHCDLCERSYISKQGLRRHMIINHSSGEYSVRCEYCNKTFPHNDYMKEHLKHCDIARKTSAPQQKEWAVEDKDESNNDELNSIAEISSLVNSSAIEVPDTSGN